MSEKSINFRDNFEDLYLRHDYLTKINTVDLEDYNKLLHIATITGKLMFQKFKRNFCKVGFLDEDVVAISHVYLYAYLGLYSIKTNQIARDKYIQYFNQKTNGRFPQEKDFERSDKDMLIIFLRQKFHHCSDVCERKSRNIICGRDVKFAIAETLKSDANIPVNCLVTDYTQHGFRKVTATELKESKKKATQNQVEQLEDKNGFKIIEVELLNNGFVEEDYEQLFGGSINEYNNSPEEFLCQLEKQAEQEEYKEKFEILSTQQKKNKISRFIEKNKGNFKYREELSQARKVLKELRTQELQNKTEELW